MRDEPSRTRRSGLLLLVAPTVLALAITTNGIPHYLPWQSALAVTGALSLLFRRRRPVVVLAVVAISFTFTLDLAPLAVAVYAIAVAPQLSRWTRALPVGVVLLVPLAYAGHARWDTRQEAIPSLLLVTNITIVMLLCTVVPTVLGLLIRSRRDQALAITELLRSREREARLTAESVRAEERTLLAREMHDVVADKISLISVRAGALASTAPADGVRAEADAIRSLSKVTLEELREVVRVLRDPAELPVERLSALQGLVAGSGLDATLTLSAGLSEESWSAAAQRAVYRTVQEALTNVRKYAASARTEVELAERDDHLDVVIRNGPGSATQRPSGIPSGGHGLNGLRERADLLGAEFSAQATTAGGFLVHVRIPVGAGRPST
jgi:signal transduction histidine kinase